MEREWEDRQDSSVTRNEAREVVADVFLLPTKCLWRTFNQPGGGILDAGTAPDRDAAKRAAEDALPKPRGLRWENAGAYLNGRIFGAVVHLSDGLGVAVYKDAHLSEDQCRQVVEYAYSLARCDTPAPAATAETGTDAAKDAADQWAERMVKRYGSDNVWSIGGSSRVGASVREWSRSDSPELARYALANALREFIKERDAKLIDAMTRTYKLGLTVRDLLADIDAGK